MASLWFLLLCVFLTTPSSLGNELIRLNQTHISVDIYHKHGPSSTLSDMLAQDQERVKGLAFRLSKNHLLSPKSVSVPLKPGFSIGAGNYYAKIGLGTPAKYFAMLVDTGSSFSWLQCKPCKVYCHTQVDPLFDPSTSKTYKSLPCTSSECSLLEAATLNQPLCDASKVCNYLASYGDASRSIGYLSSDLLTLTSSESLPGFVYGCGQDTEGLFGMAAGILGLARNKLSLLAQLSPKYGYAFSYCLPTADLISGSEGNGGFLSIGKSSLLSSASSSPFKFTPMYTDSRVPDLYYLRLISMSVQGKPLGVSATQYSVPTIIDSGTVITRLPATIYTALKGSFVKIMSEKYKVAPAVSILDACFVGSAKTMVVPEIEMLFQGGADLKLGAQNVLIEPEEGVTCLAFASDPDSDMIAIIGNRQQQTFKVAYDVTNSKIGFASGGCH